MVGLTKWFKRNSNHTTDNNLHNLPNLFKKNSSYKPGNGLQNNVSNAVNDISGMNEAGGSAGGK